MSPERTAAPGRRDTDAPEPIVDRQALRASMHRSSERLWKDADAGLVRPWVSASLERDVTAVSRFTQYGTDVEFRADEAPDRGGAGSAPSPMRYLLSGIAFCVLGWAAKTWSARDVAVLRLDLDVRTLLDTRGELGVGDAPQHPQWFVLDVRVEDSATDAAAVGMLREAVACCPISALMSRAVPVHLMLEHNGRAVLDERPAELRTEHEQEQTR
ncbi:OsmC family protein [Agromyces mangrovi Wang et al. 2018]|uniref:OsmC family protein n=1 Tax=Agromyces mangrovi TaxID=1858653 RepID=UPI002574723D|nr:OsmC family protein [Agromyces mangrovi]BDZ64395.1 hypothetical protein GCM10025877_13330 [Agromyces mangrovi]